MSAPVAERRLYLVGYPQDFHVGAHLARAAKQLGLPLEFHDLNAVQAGPRLLRSVLWRLGRRPVRLARFSQEVLRGCECTRPTHLLVTGISAPRRQELEAIRRLGVETVNYLTDDPWNPRHRAAWFMQALRSYDRVCTTRRANHDDLVQHGCRAVRYVPFGYCPEVHFPETGGAGGAADVLFVGGADADRLPYARALIENGLSLDLYGSLWNRYPEFRSLCRGHADLALQRRITPAAPMVLCLVRRANRDGHAMRSFEVPAMGGCMLLEDTPEHREIFGPDDECVTYFDSVAEMVGRARWLVEHPEDRTRLARAAHLRITGGVNTYASRLLEMLGVDYPAKEAAHA